MGGQPPSHVGGGQTAPHNFAPKNHATGKGGKGVVWFYNVNRTASLKKFVSALFGLEETG